MDGARCVSGVSLLLLLLVVVTATADATATKCRVEECPNFRAIRYHEELGCERSDDPSECCPTSFNCSSLLSADRMKCYYRGTMLELGAETGDEREDKCIPSCECAKDPYGTNGGEAAFRCPLTDCVVYAVPRDQEDICYVTDALDACCPTGVRCVNDVENPRDLAECPYNEKIYREDQRIDGTYFECKKCVCKEGFDGTLDGPWCKRQTCEYSLYHTASELRGCAPVFREGDNCCASRFHCPSADDSVVRHSETTTENEGGKCSFGDHRLNTGDELLVGTDGCVKCRCDVPPFVTCTHRADHACE
ncbi:uncharacterized protein LOC126234364 [Schistocerca nitens]|uniref:uncharacterized protein LOC126234364 n=1 Tax=Schistocerca nitens TaxID=7011 RepID=UPI002118F6FF|nr:uncharacterized protein LOC126234364 [Schistocerca nitens]